MDAETYTNYLLLQYASTFNWDALEQRCAEILDILSPLVNPIRQERRSSSEAIQQLSQTDEFGNNCLHTSCYNRPPLTAITGILQCAARAKIQLHKAVALDGSTPLGIACATGASFDVINILLDPPFGLDHGGSLVTRPDVQGNTTLSGLLFTFELRYKAPGRCPSASKLLEHVQLPLCCETNNREPALNSGSISRNAVLQALWENTRALITAAWFDANNCSNFNVPGTWTSLLHGASFVADACPPALTSLICRSCASMAFRKNRQGFLPLHLSMISGGRERKDPLTTATASEGISRRQTFWIKTLLDMFPEGAKVPFPNGRSVLCEAIVLTLPWDLRCSKTKAAVGSAAVAKSEPGMTGAEHANDGSLQYIWRSFPNALIQKDAQTGLYPFMLAAQCETDAEVEQSFEDELNQLSSIYGLLRVHPQILSQLVEGN